jgi:hypothetical protein
MLTHGGCVHAIFFAGLDLVEPGLVRLPEWRPASAGDAAVRA